MTANPRLTTTKLVVGSDAERSLAWQLDAVKIPYRREVVFAPPRRFRADFVVQPMCILDGHDHAAQEAPLLIEIDGGTWTGGRHVTGQGHAADAEKRNAAVLLGYRPLTFTPEQVESGEALATIEKALNG